MLTAPRPFSAVIMSEDGTSTSSILAGIKHASSTGIQHSTLPSSLNTAMPAVLAMAA